MAVINFDPNKYEPSTGFEPLPPGKYKCMAIDSSLKPTADGTGMRLNMTFQILEGPHVKKFMFLGFNTKNKSVDTENISFGQLSAIAQAVGLRVKGRMIHDSAELHMKPFYLTVDVKAADGKYGASNKFVKAEPLEDLNQATLPLGPTQIGGNQQPVEQTGLNELPGWAR
jgi:hypothetical protein